MVSGLPGRSQGAGVFRVKPKIKIGRKTRAKTKRPIEDYPWFWVGTKKPKLLWRIAIHRVRVETIATTPTIKLNLGKMTDGAKAAGPVRQYFKPLPCGFAPSA